MGEKENKKIIEIVDCGQERYCVRADFDVLGRMWDNEAEEFIVVKPECESESACTMIVMVGGDVVDHIIVGDEPIKVTSNLSQYPSVKVGFSFSRADGYVKNSEITTFYFLKAMKPSDFVPVEPEQKENIDYLIAKGFTGSELVNNELLFYGVNGEVVSTVRLSGFVQEQSDLGEVDATKETFVKGKSTKNLANEGEDGTSPYATEDFVARNGGKIDSISVNGTPQEIDENKNVDISVPINVADLGDAGDYAKTSQISAVENSVAELSGQVNQVNQDISSINEQIGQVNENISGINGQVSGLNETVGGLSTEVEQNNTDISGIRKQVSGLSTKVDGVEETANSAKAIAEGKAVGYVFDTYDDMTAWVAVHSAELKLGDNLYIRAVNVPDYWWDGTKVQQLETQKVDLSGYQQKLTAGDNITIENNVISASGGLPILTGTTKPTNSMRAELGQLYIETSGGEDTRIWQCIKSDPTSSRYSSYWVNIGGAHTDGIKNDYIAGGALKADYNSIAIGYNAATSRANTIQLLQGTNLSPNSFQIANDNIYKHDTHTLTVKNAQVNGNNIYGVLQGTSAPTTETVGAVGQLYVDTTSQKLYCCVVADTTVPSYTWQEVASKDDVVTTDTDQTITGEKIFDNVQNNYGASLVGNDSFRPILIGGGFGSKQPLRYAADFGYTASTKTLKTDNIQLAKNLTNGTETASVKEIRNAIDKVDRSIKRYTTRGYMGSNDTVRYYPLCKFPVYNSNNNSATIILQGRLGGWSQGLVADVNVSLGNRSGENGSVFSISPNSPRAFEIVDIVQYRQEDGTTQVYLKCTYFYNFDLNMQITDSTDDPVTINYDGTYTAEPVGTLQWSAGSATNRLEVSNGIGYIGGKQITTGVQFTATQLDDGSYSLTINTGA